MNFENLDTYLLTALLHLEEYYYDFPYDSRECLHDNTYAQLIREALQYDYVELGLKYRGKDAFYEFLAKDLVTNEVHVIDSYIDRNINKQRLFKSSMMIIT